MYWKALSDISLFFIFLKKKRSGKLSISIRSKFNSENVRLDFIETIEEFTSPCALTVSNYQHKK